MSVKGRRSSRTKCRFFLHQKKGLRWPIIPQLAKNEANELAPTVGAGNDGVALKMLEWTTAYKGEQEYSFRSFILVFDEIWSSPV